MMNKFQIINIIITLCALIAVLVLSICKVYIDSVMQGCITLCIIILLAVTIAKPCFVWCRRLFKRTYSSLKRRAFAFVKKTLQRISIDSEQTDNLDLLAPTDSADLHYVSILKQAVDDANVHNIAISGAFGSGKSSIIKTFQKLYPEYRCLNLSLANFAEEHTVETKKTVVTRENEPITTTTEYNPDTSIDINKLEYSLVQQFFYHVKNSEVPSSRYGRIRRLSIKKKLCYSALVIGFIVFEILLIKPDLVGLGGLINVPSIPQWLYKVSFVYCALALSFFVYKAISVTYRLNSAKFKAINYEIEIQKDLDVSILNRYLDELVYLFQVTDYSIVVLEDLDRFERTSIFTKLRELNLLLNQAKDIKQRIVFVYALKDEVFDDYHERTKFFDLIISVLPVVNSSNSAAIFMQKFENEMRASKDEKGLDKEVVMDLAPFIDDMRSIKSIVADFRLFKHFLHEGLQMNNLLAMLVYKTKFPADYEDLYEGQGKIASVVSQKSKLIESRTVSIQDKIKEVEDELKNVETDYLKNVEELNAIVVAAFFRSLPYGYQWVINNDKIDSSQLSTDKNVKMILDGKGAYINNYYGNIITIQSSTIKSKLPSDFDYVKRKEHLSASRKTIINELKNQHRSLQEQITHLNQMSIKEICSSDVKILDAIEECRDNTLLKFLLVKGYIDENYQYYITIPTEGILTKSDNDYLIDLKSQNEIEDPFSVSINNPESLLHYLTDADFERDGILNYNFVRFIYSDTVEAKQYAKQRGLIIKKLSANTSESLDFINRYAFTDSVSDGLLADACVSNPGLWDSVMEENGFSNEARLNLFEKIMQYASIESIEAMNARGSISEYLGASCYDVVFQNVNKEQAKSIILKTRPIFEVLIDDSKEDNLLEVVYVNNLFDLTLGNVKTILLAYSKLNESEIDVGVYTAVMGSECKRLIEIVSEAIDYFVSNVLCKNSANTRESEERLVELLNNSKILLDSKKHLIGISETKIKDATVITDIDVLKALFETNCVQVSQANINHYLSLIGLEDADERLIDYLNRNSASFCALIKAMSETFSKSSIACSLFCSNDISIDIYKELLENPVFKDEYPVLDFSDIEKSRVKMAISARFITLEPSTFDMAYDIDPNLGMCLLESDVAYLDEHFENFKFSGEMLFAILNDENLHAVHRRALSKITVEEISSKASAKYILEWLIKGDSTMDLAQFNKAIGFIDEASDVKMYIEAAIRSGMLSDPDLFIQEYLIYLGDDYKLLDQPRRDFDVNKTTADLQLVYALRDVLHLLRKVEIQEDKLICSTRYFK